MLILGLTGGIACGKSNVSDMLQSLGCRIIDGDRLSRQLTEKNGPALPMIRSVFGNEIFTDDGELVRRKLGDIVFQNDEKRACLDQIMQPLIRMMILQRIEEARNDNSSVCVLDMPLLFEKGLDQLCDRIWCVSLPEEIQVSRLMERDHLNRTQAMARINSQMAVKEKAALSHVVIDTSGSIEQTRSMIPQLLLNEQKRCQGVQNE